MLPIVIPLIFFIFLVDSNITTDAGQSKLIKPLSSSEPISTKTLSKTSKSTSNDEPVETKFVLPETPEFTADEVNGNVFLINDNSNKVEYLYATFLDVFGVKAQSLMNPLCVQKNLRATACSTITKIPYLQTGGVSLDSGREPSECKRGGTLINLWEIPNLIFSQTTFECYITVKETNGVMRNDVLYVTPRGIQANGVFVSVKLFGDDAFKGPMADVALILLYAPNVYEIKQTVKENRTKKNQIKHL